MDKLHEISLTLPAVQEDLLIVRLTLSGLGMLAGLDKDMIGDLGTVANECCDCLIHQPVVPRAIRMEACVSEGKLHACFLAEGQAGTGDKNALDLEIVRGVLETLMPEVKLQTDHRGVCGIFCSMAV